MSNRIDQLFKDTLSEHKVSPSAEAWIKVQSGLSKTNEISIVWRLAAAFVLFGALVGAWSFLNNEELIKSVELAKTNKLSDPEKNLIEKQLELKTTTTKPNITQIKKSEKRKTTNVIKTEEQHSNSEIIDMDNIEWQTTIENAVIETKSVLFAQTSQPEKPVVIEFKLESLTKPPTVEIVQTHEQENSGLKRILETARDVKNGDSDFGNIREAKNQLFALDFKKDKIKRN